MQSSRCRHQPQTSLKLNSQPKLNWKQKPKSYPNFNLRKLKHRIHHAERILSRATSVSSSLLTETTWPSTRDPIQGRGHSGVTFAHRGSPGGTCFKCTVEHTLGRSLLNVLFVLSGSPSETSCTSIPVSIQERNLTSVRFAQSSSLNGTHLLAIYGHTRESDHTNVKSVCAVLPRRIICVCTRGHILARSHTSVIFASRSSHAGTHW